MDAEKSHDPYRRPDRIEQEIRERSDLQTVDSQQPCANRITNMKQVGIRVPGLACNLKIRDQHYDRSEESECREDRIYHGQLRGRWS